MYLLLHILGGWEVREEIRNVYLLQVYKKFRVFVIEVVANNSRFREVTDIYTN